VKRPIVSRSENLQASAFPVLE